MTGWTWEHVAEHVDLPRLAHLREQWRQFPPLPVLVGHYLGAVKPPKADEVVDPLGQDFVPAQRLSADEFDGLTQALGLTTTPKDHP